LAHIHGEAELQHFSSRDAADQTYLRARELMQQREQASKAAFTHTEERDSEPLSVLTLDPDELYKYSDILRRLKRNRARLLAERRRLEYLSVHASNAYDRVNASEGVDRIEAVMKAAGLI